MATRDRGGRSDSRYFLRFAGTAGLLVAGTLVLVLVVLPQRYVLSSGFREGSVALPNPSTPFERADPLRVAALPPFEGPTEIVRGVAELFWAQVIPLLEAERYEGAIPLFATYLGSYPGDLDVRREYAITLTRAGYGDRAIPILDELLAYDDDEALRLLVARTLRDEGRVSEAAVHYEILARLAPGDQALILEWARAHMDIEDYERAEAVLLGGLEANPDTLSLQVELARLYYYTNRLQEADEILAGIPEAELVALDALQLRDDVVWALTPPPDPEVEPPPPPTLLESAIGAREEGDFTSAGRFFERAVAENPDDVETWQAYADFLQYALEDFEGALSALGEVEQRTDRSAGLQYRMAQLEVWTDHPDEARNRLESLLLLLDDELVMAASAESEEAPVAKADVQALLGDLHRWQAERLRAVERYELALLEDPDHPRALEGLALLQAEVDRMMVEVEEPRLGGIARTLADTDDFARFDLGGEWIGIEEDWVWGTTTGARWLEGNDLTGGSGNRQGAFADLEGARWWRWGTIRTALHFGVQTLRSNAVDVSAGASARFVDTSGRRTDVRFDHAPAYGLTNTLQTVFANVQQDRLSVSHAQPLNETWNLAATGEAASLDHRDVAGADRNLRVGGGLSAGRTMSRTLTLGVSTRALRYMDAAPSAGGRSLYWDPNVSVSIGPYARYRRPLSTWWEMDARVNPGLAWIDERAVTGTEAVPELSATLGFIREGPRYRTNVDFFYGQGRFTGYRSYGVNVSFSARGWFGRAAVREDEE